MLTDWLEVDIGNEWRKYDDKPLLADEIRIAFLNLQDIYYKNKPIGFRYNGVFSDIFHEGNRDCGWLLSYKGRTVDEKDLWRVLYRVFNHLQLAYAMMELTGLLKEK